MYALTAGMGWMLWLLFVRDAVKDASEIIMMPKGCTHQKISAFRERQSCSRAVSFYNVKLISCKLWSIACAGLYILARYIHLHVYNINASKRAAVKYMYAVLPCVDLG